MLKLICRALLKTVGWTLDETLPQEPRFVLIGYPHTSNWDFILAMLCMGALGYRFEWVAKHSLFFWPLGPLMRALGGIPINRSISSGFIGQMTARFQQHSQLILAITPEGTRSLTPFWKSGFYHIARSAGVPIALGYLDYGRKRLGVGPLIHPSDDERADLQQIAAYYAPIQGRYQEKAGPIRFRHHDEHQG